MKVTFKLLILIGLSIIFTITLNLPEEAWSAPKGKLVIAQGGDPTTLDPHLILPLFETVTVRNMYDYLVRRIWKDDRLQYLPMLATSWEAINDTTWIFRLRKGVKFHNGEEFNAEAVKYSIDRVLDPATKARWRWAFTSIDRVETVDPYTVKIVTKVTSPNLLLDLAYVLPIAPPRYFKEKGDAYVATHPVGTGPFRFVRWKKDDELVMEANENYWAGPPKIKTLIWKPIPEDATRISAFMGGDVDIVKNVPFQLIEMVNKSKRGKVESAVGSQSIHVYFDTIKKGPLQDKRVRQAINYGVDKVAILKHLLDGRGTILGTTLTPGHFGYDPNIKFYPYDPEKAKALLKEAGYGEGLTLTFNSPSGRYDKDKEFAEAIVGQLGKIGINVKLQVHEWGVYAPLSMSTDPGDMHTHGWAGNLDADGIWFPTLTCGKGGRVCCSEWCNKEFDNLLEQARGTLDQAKRKKLYFQAGKLLHEEAPALFLHCVDATYAVSNRVQDWKPTPDESTSLYFLETSMKD